jgi:tricorn protease
MVINEYAGSGGDWLPNAFRESKIGPLVGTRTWGGLVGIYGYPVLMDGGTITAPRIAYYSPQAGFGIENVGIPPDIEVVQTPKSVIEGHDPQLERAIQEALRLLEKEAPPVVPEKVVYPNKS